MSKKLFVRFIVAICIFTFGFSVRADSYAAFQTTNYYSANRRFFIKVTSNERATFYGKKKAWRKLWSRKLPGLPERFFISNDGKRVVMIDYYYGNGGNPEKDIIYFFDENGEQIISHSLDKVANLKRVQHTVSSAHWFYGAYFKPEQNSLIVETIVRKCEPPTWNTQTEEERKAFKDCLISLPYEELMFSTATGELISRISIQDKYSDTEKRLLHELELTKSNSFNDSLFTDLSLFSAFIEVANFYFKQGLYMKAQNYYEQAISIYARRGRYTDTLGMAIGEMAINYQRLGNYIKAEQSYKRALNILDENRGRPEAVIPKAITVYEDYASLLKERGRNREAKVLLARAEILRSVYPDYKEN